MIALAFRVALTAVVNGSTTHTASTSPRCSVAPMSGKPTSTNLMLLGSTPCDCSTALITRPPTLLSVFTAIFLPARSAGVLMGESGITNTPLKPGLALSPSAIGEVDALALGQEQRHP